MRPGELPTVCHVVHSLNFGGAEVLARQFALGLQTEFRPVFACLDDLGPMGRQLHNDGFPVCVLERRPGIDFGCISTLSRWMRRHNVDLIHAHQYAPFFYSSLARRNASGIPVLFTEHGRDYPDYRRWKRVWANRFLLRRRDHVVAVGLDVRRALIDNEGLPPERIEVIYNGVDTQLFQHLASGRAAVRAELGYSDDDFVIIQVARLNRLKDHATAIRGIAQITESHVSIRLLLVGDGEERGPLEALVETLGLRAIVRFLGSRSDVPRLLQAADLFLLTSVSEGIPLTVVEAMLAGVPIVATRVGGVPEIIVDGDSGLLAEAGDAMGVAVQIRRLFDDADLRSRLCHAGFLQAHERFNAERMLGAYCRAYRSLLPNLSDSSDHTTPSDSKGFGTEVATSSSR